MSFDIMNITYVESESMHFAVVKFFGPGRKNGKLWGFASLLDGSEANPDIFVDEPKFGSQQIKSGEIRLVKVAPGKKAPILSDPIKWVANDDGINALLNQFQMLIKTALGKDLLKRLVPDIPLQVCPEALIPFHADRSIAKRANQSPYEFIKLLKATLEFGSDLNWIRQIKVFPKISEGDFFQIVDMIDYGVFDKKLGSRLIVAQGGLSKESAHRLVTTSKVWLPLLIENVALHNLVSSEIFEGLSLVDQVEIISTSALSEKGQISLLSEIGAERLRGFLTQNLDSFKVEKIRNFESNIFYLFPFLLSSLDDGSRLNLFSKALQKTSLSSEVIGFFEEETLKILGKWATSQESCDWALGAQRQADVLLKFPPRISDQIFSEDGLLPELQHLIGCGGETDCLSVSDFRIRFGHAIGALLSAVEVNPIEFKAQRKSIESKLLNSKSDEIEKSEPSLVKLVESQVLAWLKDGVLEKKIGELGRLLPRCTMGEAPFCEAKLPGVDPKTGHVYDFPFCPRTKKGCSAAIVKSDFRKPISGWGLFELCEEAQDDGRKTEINTLAGFANRALEISSRRMSCLDCDAPLTLNPKYSKHYASYMVTVMRCSSDCGATEVYLNHCFNCQRIIDSRESKHPDPSAKSLFLCISCANGLKPWCPECGNPATEEVFGNSRKCSTCGHRVTQGAREPIPRLSLSFTPGLWANCYVHQSQSEDWTSRSEAKLLEIMATSNDGSDGF
jgi:hypothetical protein